MTSSTTGHGKRQTPPELFAGHGAKEMSRRSGARYGGSRGARLGDAKSTIRGPSILEGHLGNLRLFIVVSDVVSVGVAWLLAARLWLGEAWLWHWERHLPVALATALASYAIGVVAVFWLLGQYHFRTRWTFEGEVRGVVRAMAALGLVTFGALYVTGLSGISRGFFLVFFPLLLAGVLGSRLWLRYLLRRLRARNGTARRMLLVGGGVLAREFVDRLAGHPESGVRVAGYLSDESVNMNDLERLGTLDDLPTVLADHVIHEVAVCLPLERWALIDSVADVCEQQGKAIRIPVDVRSRVARGRLEHLDGLPVLSFISTPDRRLALIGKRALDIMGSLVGLALAAPIMAVIATAILVTDGRPVIFSNHRAGLHGRPIKVFKFRTMVRNADALREQLRSLNHRHGPDFKLADDPRVTPLGRFLRQSSLDELPQLVNVLLGQLSLVGPRVQPLDDVRGYEFWHRRRLSVKPGITGLSQVQARNHRNFDLRVELDLEYIDNWSLWLDVKILLLTVPAILRGTGDYG